MTQNAVDQFLEGVTSGNMTACQAFSPDAELDATVPNWRFGVQGAEAIRSELARWYADPGRFEELRRTPIAEGEAVEFTLCWEEQGIPHACHQIHVLGVAGGQVVSDRAWCGGRWPASLLAEMADGPQSRN
jgi:hypothetical protein